MATMATMAFPPALALFLVLTLVLAAAAKPAIHCPRDDHIAECLGKSFIHLVADMLAGDPEHGVPKLDPLLVPLMPVNKNAGKILNLNMTFSNFIITDIAKDVSLKSSKFDFDKLDLTMQFFRPAIYFRGHYKLSGKVLWLPLWGKGDMTMNMTDVSEVFHIKGQRMQGVNGKTHWHVTDYMSTLAPKMLTVHYDNLFNGNRVLGTAGNALLNSQWKLVYGQLEPITDRHFSRIMKPYWTDILSKIPLDEAFPEK